MSSNLSLLTQMFAASLNVEDNAFSSKSSGEVLIYFTDWLKDPLIRPAITLYPEKRKTLNLIAPHFPVAAIAPNLTLLFRQKPKLFLSFSLFLTFTSNPLESPMAVPLKYICNQTSCYLFYLTTSR